MTLRRTFAATAAGMAALSFGGLPLAASAGIFDELSLGGTYSVGYGPGTSMCPSYENNYRSCPSGIGGLFGAQTGYGGGYGSYGSGYGGYAPTYNQPYYGNYQQPQYSYYPPQQNYYYQPQPTYYQPQQYAHYPQQEYYYQPSYGYNYDYGYYPQTVYGPIIYY